MGYYWHRRKDGWKFVTFVAQTVAGDFITFDDAGDDVELPEGGDWAGPIPEPVDLKKPHSTVAVRIKSPRTR